MIRTTSLKHYKALRAEGINCQLVTKADLNGQSKVAKTFIKITKH